MGTEVLIGACMLGLILFSSPQKANANYVGTYKDLSSGIEVDYPFANEDLDYTCIYTFISRYYPSVSPEDAQEITRSLITHGKEHQVDPKFTAALIARESAFNRRAISVTGAKGLGQIKDFNFPSLGIQDPYNIQENVAGTTKYIKSMLFSWEGQSSKVALALASYFKGYTAVKNDAGNLDAKTAGYVRDILSTYDKLLKSRAAL
jgi:soluble lytic murein transglycosylase-like protein